MYFRDHGNPHFHAVYGEYNGVFDINSMEMIEGDLPRRARKLILDWAEQYKTDLINIWNRQEFKQLPGLEQVVGTHRISKVVADPKRKILLVTFRSGDVREYSCQHLLRDKNFEKLMDDNFFLQARVDEFGYGIVWDDTVDLSEGEIWINGQNPRR